MTRFHLLINLCASCLLLPVTFASCVSIITYSSFSEVNKNLSKHHLAAHLLIQHFQSILISEENVSMSSFA